MVKRYHIDVNTQYSGIRFIHAISIIYILHVW